MASSDSPFRVIVLSAAGVTLGETANAIQLNNTVSLDKIGSCRIVIPAVDPVVPLIRPGVMLDCYDEVDGYVGRFYFKNRNIVDNGKGASLSVNCSDNLVALQRQFVGYRRAYNFIAVNTVVADLLAVAGWTGVIDTGIGSTTVDYEGESVFAAIDVLRDRWFKHFRLGTVANQLQFGAFGHNSGVLLQNLEGQMQALFEANTQVAHVSTINENIDADGIYNRIVATSGGTGSETELTLKNAAVGTYPVLSGINQDGTLYYYIQDNASIAAYGLRTKVVKYTGIHPISNNATDVQRAVDATKYAAEAYLTQNKDPRVEYSLEVLGLRSSANVGDLVTLDYHSIGTWGTGYLDVTGQFYLMDIKYNRDSNGGRSQSLSVASQAQRRTSDTDVIVDVISDIEVLKLHIQPYPFWKESDSQDYVGKNHITLAQRDARFVCEINNSVMKLTKVIIRFKSRPLTFVGLIGSPSLSPWSAVYAMLEGDQHPKGLKLFIDNVDVTTKYGGSWNNRLSGTPGIGWTIGQFENNALDVTLDITDDIVNSPLGMQADHEIRFSSQADALNAFAYLIPGHGAGTSLNGDATSGIIQCNIQIQGVTQGIVPT